LIHASFSIHEDHSLERGARLVNLPVPLITAETVCGTAADADLIVRLAERNLSEAAEALLEGWREGAGPLCEPPDQLAKLLSGADCVPIHVWSERCGVARQTVFRSFRALYGVSPTRYRIEARARRAWQLIVVGRRSLIDAALQAGYVDQAHMSRDLKKLTGQTPGAWAQFARLYHSSKTAAEFA
jgi:AraC-like DNA-binding protein